MALYAALKKSTTAMARYAAWKNFSLLIGQISFFSWKWDPQENEDPGIQVNILQEAWRGHSAGRSRVGANTEESG